MKHRWFALTGLVVLVALVVARNSSVSDPVQDEIQRTSLKFFLDHAHPLTGMIRDKAENFKDETADNNVASIASTGFGLAVISHAALQGQIEKDFAKDYCAKTVRFMRDKVPRKHGWFLHWVDWETGERAWNSEYSTIDSALFLGGALYAARVFPNTECAALVDQVYRETDFMAAMTDSGAKPEKRSINMGYIEGRGWMDGNWDMYAEQKLLIILGLGHPTAPLPEEAWLAFRRDSQETLSGEPLMGLKEALFVHQYSELFLDFRNFGDPTGDFWRNGQRISEYHREIARKDTMYKTLKEGFWGFSAGESPTGYTVYSGLKYRGTVCIGCTIASAMYLPEVVMKDLAAWMNSPYKDKIWGRYGFTDSIDLDQDWYGSRVLGITAGPAYMSLANMKDSTSFWKVFMQIPEIKAGMEKAKTAGLYKVSKAM